MFTKIVVPVDGSEPSNEAVKLALRLASEGQAEVIFVHAVELHKIVALAAPAPMDPSYAIDAACAAGRELLDQMEEQAESAGVRVACELPEDEVISSVLEVARQRKADLIVVGSHGRSGIPRALLGSVAEGILRRSPIPVLVCHMPKAHQDGSAFVKSSAHTAEQTIV
jgi:nucleotide-binding universal stress UspA family protein